MREYTEEQTLLTMAAMWDLLISYTLLITSEGANSTSLRGYNEHLSHTDDIFHVHLMFIT